MKDYDFSICEFIKREMWFFTFYDFCDNRKYIKKLFKTFNTNERRMYLWYVYANIHMNETYKNYIWDYLNGNIEDIDLLNAKRFYKAK